MQDTATGLLGTVETARLLDFPAAQVWSVLGDFGNHSWVPAVRHAKLIGEGMGAVRRLTTDTGIVDERLDAYDAHALSYAYSIVSPMPYPVEDYRVSVQIDVLAPARSRVRWRAQFRAKGVSVIHAEQLMTGVYVSIGDWLEQELARRFSVPV